MSRSLLHDWEHDIERCCRENLPCEMTEIAEDIYNTAYVRGKNSVDDEVLDKIRAEIMGMYREILKGTSEDDWILTIKWNHCLDEVLQIIDKYKRSEGEK